MGISSDDLLKKIDKAPVGILILSGEFEIIFLSDTFRKIAEHYNFKYPSDNLNSELFDLDVLREDFNYLSMGYSFEKEIKSIHIPGIGKISIIMKGIPFMDEDRFTGGILSVEDIRLYSGQEFTESIFQIKDILKASGDYLFITDVKGMIRFSTGRKYSSEIIYQNIFDIVSESNKKEFAEKFELAGIRRFTQKIITSTMLDREEYECRIDPLLNEEGKPNYFLFTFNELGQTVKENQQLKIYLQNSEKFRSAADNADEMIYIYDRNLQLHYSNRKAENLPDLAEHFNKKEILNKLNNHPKFSSEFEVEGKIYSAVFTNSGEDLITCFCREVTSEKQELKRIKDSESLLYHLVAGSEQVILNISPTGNILYSNKFFRENFDITEGNFLSIIEKNYAREFSIPIVRKSNIEIPLVSHGTIKNYSFSFNPIFSAEGEVQHITVTGTDISRLIDEQQGLRVYKDVFNNAADGLAVIRNEKLLLVNLTFAKLFGYSKEDDLKGKRITEISSLSDKNRLYNHIREIEISDIISERFEFTGQKADGSDFYVSASFSPIISGNSVCVIMICRDITEMRRVQGIIRESEEKFRNLTENIDDFLYTYERSGGIQRPVFYTASVEKVTGYTQEEFLNDSRLLFKIMHPDDLPPVKKKLKVLLRSRLQSSEEIEFRIINRNGNIVWVRNKLNLIRDEQGEIQKIYGLVGDITLRKKAEDELKRSTENLLKLNEAKDKFISIVSHDLRTPFSSILGFTDLLLNDDELTEEEKKQYAQYIQESSKTMLSLVNSLLDLTRLQTGRIRFEPEKFYPAAVIDEVIQVLSGSAYQKRIDIINNVNRDNVVFADKSLLLQAFNNLVSNAIKFTRPGGRITISASPSDKIRFLQFSVKDSGIGIKEENLDNLFKVDAKYTSEGTAGEKGSGLGLSLVKEIVEKHGGEIWVESIYDEGSEFKFNIPITPSNILLVDDNSTDKLLYSKILKNFAQDYNIETASNGKEALEKILISPPALIITDHLMPELNGYEMILKLKRSRLREIPPVIVLSSELDRNSIQAYRDAGIEHIFNKPVNLAEFKQAVEKLLRKGFLQK